MLQVLVVQQLMLKDCKVTNTHFRVYTTHQQQITDLPPQVLYLYLDLLPNFLRG